MTIATLRRPLSLTMLLAALTPACEPAGDSGHHDKKPASICKEPTGEPIVHQGGINASETWSADAVHVVDGTFQLAGGSTLTLDACVQVRMRPAAMFDLRADGNAIVSLGEANARVSIVADDPAAGWGNVRVLPSSSLSLAYTTIEDGGHEPANNALRAVLDVHGDQEQPAQPLLHVDHVEIVVAEVTGIALDGNAGFTAESTALTITGSGSYPVRAWPIALTNLPDGDYTGNARDEIVIPGHGGWEILGADATLHDRGVRYLVGDELSGSMPVLRVAAGEGGLATLTIDPGVELAFGAGGVLEIEHYTGTFPASGALVAVGTEEAPIRFTSADSTTRGAWVGLYFGGVPAASDRIEHAVIEYAGGVTGTENFSCSPIENGRDQAAVLVLGEPSGPFIQATHIAHSGGQGIDRGWDGGVIDFASSNTFEDIAWCVQSAPHDSSHACPKSPSCVTAP